MTFLPKAEVLSLEELDRLCSAFVRTRREEAAADRRRAAGAQERDVADQGPGSPSRQRRARGADAHHKRFSQLAKLRQGAGGGCGVRRLNVSIDTLDADKFRETDPLGRSRPGACDGLDAAQDAGLHIKINAVALRGVNDMEFDRLIRWSARPRHGSHPDRGHADGRDRAMRLALDQYLPLSLAARFDIEQAVHADRDPTIKHRRPGALLSRSRRPAVRLGFITPMTHNFCESCNRVRLTCTGTLYMCLGQEDAADLRAPLARLRERRDPVDRGDRPTRSRRKPKGHDFIIDRRTNRPSVSRHMSVTGG